MSHVLQENSTNLQTILSAINELPVVVEQVAPEISVSSNGLITATAGTKSATHQLAFQAAKTITPSTASQIAVSSGYYTGGDITVAAIPSSYVVPSGTLTIGANGTHDVTNYASAVVNVESSGSGDGYDEVDNLIARTTTSYTNSRAEIIGANAFYNYSSLTTVSFHACESIGSSAFYDCSSLTTASFPACKRIGMSAFYNCSSLTTVSFPACTNIYMGAFTGCYNLTTASFPVCTDIDLLAFYNCSSLTTVSFPACTNIGARAFTGCYNLTTASFPACTEIGSSVFSNCSSLTTASFPACKRICMSAFYNCSSLTTVSFPACESIGSSAFYKCSRLTTVSFPACTNIDTRVFTACSRLSSLTLEASTICTLANSNAFLGTPYAGYSSYFSGTPHIYVPSSLVASYQAATNWTYFSSYIVAM